MNDGIVTDFLFSEQHPIGKQSEKSISSIILKILLAAYCDAKKDRRLTQLPTRCNQKTLPIQSCIVSMSCLFVDTPSICISVLHQRWQLSCLQTRQNFTFPFFPKKSAIFDAKIFSQSKMQWSKKTWENLTLTEMEEDYKRKMRSVQRFGWVACSSLYSNFHRSAAVSKRCPRGSQPFLTED